MIQPSLRAQALDGSFVTFTLEDIPIKIYDTQFILANRPNSPVLLTESICRMLDHLPVGEGDVVQIDGSEYLLTYLKGFTFVRASDSAILPAHLVNHCTLISTGTSSTAKIQCKCQGRAFPILGILGAYEGAAFIPGLSEPVDPRLIQLSAGFAYRKQSFFFGDEIDGHPLILWRGCPCIQRGDEHIEYPTKRLLLWKEANRNGTTERCTGREVLSAGIPGMLTSPGKSD